MALIISVTENLRRQIMTILMAFRIKKWVSLRSFFPAASFH